MSVLQNYLGIVWGHIGDGQNLFLRPFRILVGSVCISFLTFQFWGFRIRWALQPRAVRRNFTRTYYWVEKHSGGERGEKMGVGPPVRPSVLARSATWVRRAWSVRDRVRVATCCILARGGAKMGCCPLCTHNAPSILSTFCMWWCNEAHNIVRKPPVLWLWQPWYSAVFYVVEGQYSSGVDILPIQLCY